MKHISKSRSLMIILCMMCLFFLSCRSLDPSLYTIHCDSVAYTIHQSVDTIVVRDSVCISERQRGDTIYLTRTEWRDRWRTRIERDTVVDVRVEKEVVQLPPERYVPKFYKWCTIALWAIGLLVMGRLALKLWCRV